MNKKAWSSRRTWNSVNGIAFSVILDWLQHWWIGLYTMPIFWTLQGIVLGWQTHYQDKNEYSDEGWQACVFFFAFFCTFILQNTIPMLKESSVQSRELLEQVISLNEQHLHTLLREYIRNYYNTDRTHQGIVGKTPIPSPVYLPTPAESTRLEATPVLNGLYHAYKKVA